MKILEIYLKQKLITDEYIKAAFKLRKMINKTVKSLPKSYRYVSTNNLLSLCQEVTINCLKSYSIKLAEDLEIDDFKEKQFLLRKVSQTLVVIELELVFLFEMINEGNSVFNDPGNKIFDKLIKLTIKLRSLINNQLQINISKIKKIKRRAN